MMNSNGTGTDIGRNINPIKESCDHCGMDARIALTSFYMKQSILSNTQGQAPTSVTLRNQWIICLACGKRIFNVIAEDGKTWVETPITVPQYIPEE